MATREVDEAQFLEAQGVIAAVNEILAHKDARQMMLKARKLANPKVVIPEIDAAAPINNEVAELRKIIEDDRRARAQEREEAAIAAKTAEFQNEWDKQKRRLRDAGWRSEGIEAVEKHAQERGIGDLEVAAAHWEKLNPPQEPAMPNGGASWGFFDQPADDDKFVEKLLSGRGEDESALSAEIASTLRDFRTQSGARR